MLDFPGGAVVESPPADAGDTGSCPGPGRSHMLRSGWAREPWPLSLCIRSLCSAMGEATTVRGPHTTIKKKKKIIHEYFSFFLCLTVLEKQSHPSVLSPGGYMEYCGIKKGAGS